MKNLWDNTSILKELIHAPMAAFFFDFDGTLVPLATAPDNITVPPQVVTLLTELSQRDGRVVGIISGRSVADLSRFIALPPRIMIAGNHGLEWVIRGEYKPVALPDGYGAALRDAYAALSLYAKEDVPGLSVEWKELTVSVHLRQVSDDLRDEVTVRIEKLVRQVKGHESIRLLRGARDMDLRPDIPWTKAEVVAHFLQEGFVDYEHMPMMYVGDDTTDEDVFLSFSNAVTIHVGDNEHSRANYGVRNVTDVRALLATLARGELHR